MADKGLDFTPDLVFTTNDFYIEQMALVMDKNEASCVTLTSSAGRKWNVSCHPCSV